MDRAELLDKWFKLRYRMIWYPRFFLPGTKPVLVYTMAKVGSMTMLYTLFHHNVGGPVTWGHRMLPANVKITADRRREKGLPQYRYPILNYVYNNYILKERPIDIVTMVRDPIARNVSAFFQAYDYFIESQPEGWNMSMDKMLDIYDKEIMHEVPLGWLDFELKAVTGVDVYSKPFDHEKGYTIFDHDLYKTLVLKIETSDDAKLNGMKEMFGLSDMTIYRGNVGSDKSYADTYKDFKDSLRLTPEYVNKMYDSKYMNHFYTPDEVEKFKARWLVHEATAQPT